MPGGSSDCISLRPPRPPVTVTLRVICPAPQDIVPEKANEKVSGRAARYGEAVTINLRNLWSKTVVAKP